MGCNTTGHSQNIKRLKHSNVYTTETNLHADVPVNIHRYVHAGIKVVLSTVMACNATSERNEDHS